VDPDATWFHDPRPPHQGLLLNGEGDLPNQTPHPAQGGAGVPQDDQSGMVFRRVIENLSEVQINRDQAASEPSTRVGKRRIVHAVERLLPGRGHRVPRLLERLSPSRVGILVQLEAERQLLTSIGSTRSRVSSAAYAKHA